MVHIPATISTTPPSDGASYSVNLVERLLRSGGNSRDNLCATEELSSHRFFRCDDVYDAVECAYSTPISMLACRDCNKWRGQRAALKDITTDRESDAEFEIISCEVRRIGTSGEAAQNYRKSLKSVQHVDSWKIRSVRRDRVPRLRLRRLAARWPLSAPRDGGPARRGPPWNRLPGPPPHRPGPCGHARGGGAARAVGAIRLREHASQTVFARHLNVRRVW